MRCAAYLRLSRVEQNNGMAIERQLFAVQKACSEFNGSLDFVLEDLMSGRKTDRPNIERLEQLIKDRSVEAIVFYRVDRLGRDITLLNNLGKLLEKTGVRAYVCAKGGFIDWKKTEDWEYWVSAAVAAEKESRVISDRLRQAHEFNKFKGQASFKVPLGYKRVNRQYQLSNDGYAQWLLDRLIANKGNIEKTIQEIAIERGQRLTTTGLRNWIDNPLHRQLIDTGEIDSDGQPIKRRLISVEQDQELERYFNDRRLFKSKEPKRYGYTLTGFLFCSCGARASVARNSKNRYDYIRCRAGEGQNVLALPKHEHTMCRFDWAEEEVINQLCAKAEHLKEIALDNTIEAEEEKSPEQLKLERQIDRVHKDIAEFGDEFGNYANQLKALKEKLSKVSKKETDSVDREILRSQLKSLDKLKAWVGMSEDLRREWFLKFIDRVTIDFRDRIVFVSFKRF